MFEVTWHDDAARGLAAVWLNSRDRRSITRAAHEIDAVLRKNPLLVGESRTGKDRVVFIGPIGVIYRVFSRTKKVLVLEAGRSMWKKRR